MDLLVDDLRMLRDMRERLSAMLARLNTNPDLRDSDELMHVTRELIKSLAAEIQALEKVIGGIEHRNVEQ